MPSYRYPEWLRRPDWVSPLDRERLTEAEHRVIAPATPDGDGGYTQTYPSETAAITAVLDALRAAVGILARYREIPPAAAMLSALAQEWTETLMVVAYRWHPSPSTCSRDRFADTVIAERDQRDWWKPFAISPAQEIKPARKTKHSERQQARLKKIRMAFVKTVVEQEAGLTRTSWAQQAGYDESVTLDWSNGISDFQTPKIRKDLEEVLKTETRRTIELPD